jgi:transcriptional regulator with PAS, ATPase and Fis domain
MSVKVTQRANGGTLLLDEVTGMPVELQVKLLRVLEVPRCWRGPGTRSMFGSSPPPAAPDEAVADGLREDLLYRLQVFLPARC